MTQTVDFPDLANNQDWEWTFTLTNDETSPPEPHILEASTVRLMLRSVADPTDIKVDVTLASIFPDDALVRLTLKDLGAAKVMLSVRARKMRSIPDGAYKYDIIVVRPTGRTYRPVKGTVTLAMGVTDLP